MFKKRNKKKRPTKKTSSIQDETEEEARASSLQPSILEATRAEQMERTKRRGAQSVVVSGDGQPNIKRRRGPTKSLLTQQQEQQQLLHQQDDTEKDKHMEEYIAQRMGSSTSSSTSSSSTSSTTNDATIEQTLDPYGLLRREKTHLTAEQGGVSGIAGSGIAGIGIYEVELPDDVKKRNAEKTLQAVVLAKNSHKNSDTLAGLNLPCSFSGNFIKSQHLLYRGDAVTAADGSRIPSKHQSGSGGFNRATDFKALKKFKQNVR